MEQLKPLTDFFDAIRTDPYVGSSHIAVFTALYNMWVRQGCQNPLLVFSYTVMPEAKIGGLGTYHRVIKELDGQGYLRYVPCFNRKGSKVYFNS